jgi:hypothetical protein
MEVPQGVTLFLAFFFEARSEVAASPASRLTILDMLVLVDGFILMHYLQGMLLPYTRMDLQRKSSFEKETRKNGRKKKPVRKDLRVRAILQNVGT